MKKIIALLLAFTLVGSFVFLYFYGLNNPKKLALEEEVFNKYQEKSIALQLEFENKVNDMIDDAKVEYYALSPEKRNDEKYDLAFKYMATAAELEKECDKQIEAILEEIGRASCRERF